MIASQLRVSLILSRCPLSELRLDRADLPTKQLISKAMPGTPPGSVLSVYCRAFGKNDVDEGGERKAGPKGAKSNRFVKPTLTATDDAQSPR